MKKILVVGKKEDITLFSMIGAITFEVKDSGQLSQVVKYVEERPDVVAGVVISSQVYDEDSRDYKRLARTGVPIVNLDGKTDLNRLSEETIGIKLN